MKSKLHKLLTISTILFFALTGTALATDEACPTCPPPDPPPVAECCDFGDMTAGLWIDTDDVINQATTLECDFMETIESGAQFGIGHIEVTPGVSGDISAFLYHQQVIDESAELPGGFEVNQFGAAASALYAAVSVGDLCPVGDFVMDSHRDASILNQVTNNGDGMLSNMHVDAGSHLEGIGLDVDLAVEHNGAYGYSFVGPNGFQTGLIQFNYSGGDLPDFSSDD